MIHGEDFGASDEALMRVLAEVRAVAARTGLRPGKNGKPREVVLAERWDSDLLLGVGHAPLPTRHLGRSMWEWGIIDGYRVLSPK